MGTIHYLTLSTTQATQATARTRPEQWRIETQSEGIVTKWPARYVSHGAAVKAFSSVLRSLPAGTQVFLVNPQGRRMRVR